MQRATPNIEPKTIVIDNFSGRLTRILNGELNSGFAKFNTSFGYDPFSKPLNLTWLETASDITGPITDLILDAKTRSNTSADGQTFVIGVGNAGKLYKIQPNSLGSVPNPNIDSVIGIGSVTAGNPSYNFGASMDFFGAPEKVFVTSDTQINKANTDGSADTIVANTNIAQTYHPVRQFIGKLLFGNGNTIAAIDNTGTVTSSIIGTGQGNLYSQLNPPLGVREYVHDLDLSIDGNYLLATSSTLINEAIGILNDDYPASSGSSGYLHRWNGSDNAITSSTSIPSYAVTALQTYLSKNFFFANDSFGASLNDSGNKLLTLINNKAPTPNATTVNGNFTTWLCPEFSTDNTMRYASLYYFGSLDQENPPGLYRLLRLTPALANGFVYQTPVNVLTTNKYSTINTSRSSVVSFGLGKHYLSVWETSNASANSYKLYRFLVTPTGTGTPQTGVYETQTKLFSKRISVSQIRVYTEPTATGNAFQLDMIGSDGNVISNGSFTYTYGSIVDSQNNSPSVERVGFDPSTKTQYSLGIRITNTGSTNMTIKKIEVDYTEEGK